MTLITIIYGIKGGMSDAGKFALSHAIQREDVTVRAVAVSMASKEGSGIGLDIDVTDKELEKSTADIMKQVEIKQVDINSSSAQQDIDEAIKGSDAVVAAIGSRQPFYPRYLNTGAKMITKSMEKHGVKRLVMLSSFGIGDDYLPMSGMKIFWGTLLRTVILSGFIDLKRMESTIRNSSLDYLLVRPVGLTPEAPPTGRWKLLQSRKDGNLNWDIAKSDVGAFMLNEAISPTLNNNVTIGSFPEGEK